MPAEKGARYPLCLEGERACPPEDVGGTYGYQEYVKAMANPRHKRHKEFLEWSGPFDPEKFDAKAATKSNAAGLAELAGDGVSQMSMRILVTGGRRFDDKQLLYTFLDRLHQERSITLLIHGAAQGADSFAEEWGKTRGVETLPCLADIERYNELVVA